MRITVIGLGYVGLVTSACLADLGHRITGVDTSEHRLDSLRAGKVPFHEPGLTPMVEAAIRDGRIVFSADSSSAVHEADIVIIAVGTHDGNGGWQTGTILRALGDVVPAMADDAVLMIRSTMPPGFVHQVGVIAHELRARHGRPAIAAM
ncbi:MAG TPA: 2-dehydropantoate 2-reductase N-terminal domain-containing protein, partial [Candidatus Limnocylindrales bacterium]|nr:2-dehydropantoate 2-reductase N-terminal domain-containing protein [Candidatus Limnocylindrales bacterium]